MTYEKIISKEIPLEPKLFLQRKINLINEPQFFKNQKDNR